MASGFIYSLPLLQIAVAETAPVSAHPDPGRLSSTLFNSSFIVQALGIWVALIVISLIVFAYRRRNKENRRSFPQVYEDELEAMRKGGDD